MTAAAARERLPAARLHAMNLSAPFIRRPVATSLLTLAIALAGAMAFRFAAGRAAAASRFPDHSV